MDIHVDILDLMDDELSAVWLLKQLHPNGMKCPHCGRGVEHAREFRRTTKSHLVVYRCNSCQGIYNLYSGTILAGKHLRPAQAALLLRGAYKGRPITTIAHEIGVDQRTIQEMYDTIRGEK